MSRPAGKIRLGVLVSGGGTNLQSLLDAAATPDYPAQVAVVISNVGTALALQRAARAGVPAVVVDHRDFPDRTAFEHRLLEVLAEHQVEWICLAGFMRLLGSTFLSAHPHRVINIHPALLPAFPGMHGVRQALAHGAKLAGCTVHLVDEGTDTGPILAQAAVPVLPTDDEQSLGQRIQVEEHRLYPLVVRLVAEGRLTLEGRVARLDAHPDGTAAALRNPGRS